MINSVTKSLVGWAGLNLQPHHGAFLEDALNYAKHLLAGALSAVVSRTCCAPMETVKMQMIFNHRSGGTMQVAAEVLREQGIAGFWRGNGAAQLLHGTLFMLWQRSCSHNGVVCCTTKCKVSCLVLGRHQHFAYGTL